MKKITFFLLLLLLPSAFAVCIGGNDQLIFRISSQTNAHAELYNGAGNYPVEICYDQIFGQNYSGTNPHDCVINGSNIVLNASAATNAHVEQNDQANYLTNICFGNLECGYTASGGGGSPACSSWRPGAECIATISAVTNTHVSAVCNGPGSFPIAVCCTSVSQTTKLKIVSFTIDPTSVVTDNLDKIVVAIAKVKNYSATTAENATVKIEIKDSQGNQKIPTLEEIETVNANEIKTFNNLSFTVDNTWQQGTYTATTTLFDEDGELQDSTVAYFTVSSFSVVVSETNQALLLIIAIIVISIAYFSAKKQGK